MAHEIETHGTQAAAVYARKDAWHRLGTTVRDPLSRDLGLTVTTWLPLCLG